MADPSQPRIEQHGPDALLWVKAVPGASRDAVAGVLGDRLKVRVSAAAEGGKANKSICVVIAATLGVKPRQVTVESGHTNPEKVVRVAAVTAETVRARLGG